MIDKNLVRTTVEQAIAGTDIFIVDINIDASNRIVVELDSPDGIDINTCADITRKIEAVFDRDKEDYELEVGSAGITAPFKVVMQYTKNIGNEVEVLTNDGRKLIGKLVSVDGTAGTFTIEVPTKVKQPGQKRPVVEQVPYVLEMDKCKHVKYNLKFK